MSDCGFFCKLLRFALILSIMEYFVLETGPSKDYELIDTGEGEKLERFGDVIIWRPDPQSLWNKRQPSEWQKAEAKYAKGDKSKWDIISNVPEKWQVNIGGIDFIIKPSAFKHVGVFPEQSANWAWIEDAIKNARRPVSVLNLFGYTGGATLASAKAGAEVCHLDGSKVAISRAKENAAINGLENKPIRWILDDAISFIKREIKRGRKYDAVIADPPAFGHGPNGELWKIENDLPELVGLLKEILSDKPLFIILNGYASGYSPIAYANNIDYIVAGLSGNLEVGELAIRESGVGGRLLPCGIFARWQAK